MIYYADLVCMQFFFTSKKKSAKESSTANYSQTHNSLPFVKQGGIICAARVTVCFHEPITAEVSLMYTESIN